MLSVINRGTSTSSNDGLPYVIKYGYVQDSYFGQAIEIMKLANIPTPIDAQINPVVKEGYTAISVDPTEG